MSTEKPRLNLADYTWAAQKLGVSVAHIRAVAELESRGRGFLPTGEPVILFERHVFRNFTNGFYSKQYPEISGAPGGYGAGGQNQHRKLALAASLNRDAALQSASWGVFQVMGFNWKLCGYESLQHFINAMYRSERDHLDACIRFIQGAGLVPALKNKDWARFARGYNGPGYAKNKYDTKLAAAYKKFGGF